MRAECAFIHLFIEDEKLIKGPCFELPAPSLLLQQVSWYDELAPGKEAKFSAFL